MFKKDQRQEARGNCLRRGKYPTEIQLGAVSIPSVSEELARQAIRVASGEFAARESKADSLVCACLAPSFATYRDRPGEY